MRLDSRRATLPTYVSVSVSRRRIRILLLLRIRLRLRLQDSFRTRGNLCYISARGAYHVNECVLNAVRTKEFNTDCFVNQSAGGECERNAMRTNGF